MKALVTGGAGFIGSHLIDELLLQGHDVTAIDNFSTGQRENIAQHKNNINFTVYEKDITEDLTDVFALEAPEVVFHLAAIPRVQRSIEEPRETHHVNINGTFNLLQLAKHYNVKRFIFSSSSSVYGDQDLLPLQETMKANPMSPYALQKFAGEEYVRLFHDLYDLETISLRYFNVYGPRLNPDGGYACLIPKSIKKIINDEQPEIYGGGQTRDFTYVGDVVAANILAATTENNKAFGQIFNIGAGNNQSVEAVIEKIVELARSDIKPRYLSPVVEPKDTLADISKTKMILGWEPACSFDNGIRLTFDSIAL